MFRYLFIVFVFCSLSSRSQDIDVRHYQYQLTLSDSTDVVVGRAAITIKFLKAVPQFSLDFSNAGGAKGMQVVGVYENGIPVDFKHEKDRIMIKTIAKETGERTYDIQYSGIPQNGLIISKNKFGDRTFFADNWPNRAHFWLPCIDRPDDKASFEFMITAPSHYGIVSNGTLVENRVMNGQKRFAHWRTNIALPTKVMVIGVARFAVKEYPDSPKDVPVSAWIFTQDSTKGFHDYAAAPSILKYFTNYIGPYPFEKLANVQSKTMFGGMENASAIFYNETTVTGKGEVEDLLAHEIAHQWFGDMVSETSFTHLWLSEGFATYLTNVYLETKYGKEVLKKRMEEDRQQVIDFVKSNKHAVVDSTTPFMELLNANSYQKGGWVLHMLRRETGDSLFQKILQAFYRQFSGRNAASRDFEAVAEQVSGKELTPFFDQWLYTAGIPNLQIKWESSANKFSIKIEQKGPAVFRFPLELKLKTQDGKEIFKKMNITGREEKFEFPVSSKISKVDVDPDVNLLAQFSIKED